MAQIAIVEDDETVATSLSFSLGRSGHETVVFADGREAYDHLLRQASDLAILDLSLPGMDGLELCRNLRSRKPSLPIIILTARGEEIDRVVGLESGADDYVVKPFSLREMEARVKALLRRSSPASPTSEWPVLRSGRFVLDRRSGTLTIDNRPIELSRREEEVLAVLMEGEGHLVTRNELLSRVWGEQYIGEAKTLDVHIRWLRLKIEPDPSCPRHIQTFRGRGYRFCGD
jgi:DNA-binding response OmpR family regulator